jgi:hypothetical protein
MATDWVLITQISYVLIGGAIALQLLKQLIYYPFFHPLARFPGPYWASVTRLWIARESWVGTELATLQRLHEKYGRYFWCSVVRIAD